MQSSIVGMVAFGASPAQAATAAGPYYAPPSWDQQLQCDTPSTCPRFIVLSNWGNAAVLDRETGLVWEQSPSGDSLFNWEDAQGHCNKLTTGNRLGWRLPTLQEAASLVDPSSDIFGYNLPPGIPFSNMPSGTWSATASNASDAWTVRFLDFGPRVLSAAKSAVTGAWCVRGGQGVDFQ